MSQLVRQYPFQFPGVEQLQQAAGHRNGGVLRIHRVLTSSGSDEARMS